MLLAAKTSIDEICYFCTELDSVLHNILIKKLGRLKKALINTKADWEADGEVMGKPENAVVIETSSKVVCFNRVPTELVIDTMGARLGELGLSDSAQSSFTSLR